MHRSFCSSENIIGNKIIISDRDQIHHLKAVLRLKIGNELVVCDEKGNVYNSLIEEITSKNMVLKIKAPKKDLAVMKKIRITVACAIPKKSKFDDIIDKLTQLGADRIIPMETERVIVKFDRDKQMLRLGRWKKLALNASEQSQRSTLPIIEPVKKLREVLSGSRDYDLKLIPVLIGKRKILNQVLSNTTPQNILVLIGPEGDFTPEELTLAKSAGFIPVTLGDLVLRVETAAIAVMSILNYVLK